MKYLQFHDLCQQKTSLIRYLIDTSVLSAIRNCEKCGGPMTLDDELINFTCNRRTKIIDCHKKPINSQCKIKRSIFSDSIFYDSHIGISKICEIIGAYLLLHPPHTKYLEDELSLSAMSVAK